jgi:chromosome segregation ATPase
LGDLVENLKREIGSLSDKNKELEDESAELEGKYQKMGSDFEKVKEELGEKNGLLGQKTEELEEFALSATLKIEELESNIASNNSEISTLEEKNCQFSKLKIELESTVNKKQE